MDYTITITETQKKAMETVAVDIDDWITNAATAVTLTGTNYISVPQVEAINSTGAITAADSITFTSATTIVFMGKRSCSQLQKKLARHGLLYDTPALLAEAVSTPQQKLILTTIKDLADKLEKDISPQPALIFYGPLAEGFMDYEN